jgi:amino acid permease
MALQLPRPAASFLCLPYCFFAMNKYVFDLVIALSIETEGARGSFEHLGAAAYGIWERLSVMFSKALFIFGCLVVYVVAFKDNFTPAVCHLLYGTSQPDGMLSFFHSNSCWTTAACSTIVVLPLVLLRDVSPLAQFSVLKLGIYLFIMCFVFKIQIESVSKDTDSWNLENLKQHWIQFMEE